MEKKENYPKILTVSLINFSSALSLSLSLSLSPYTLLGFYCFKLIFIVSNFLSVVSIFYYIVSQLFCVFLCFRCFFYRILLLLTLCSFLLLSIFSFFLNVSHPVSLLFYAVSYCFFLVISYSLFLFKLFLSSLFLLFFLILFYIFRKLFYPFLLPLSHSF